MNYFLAVDAGGTKTEFLLADESTELGRVRTGTIKRLRQDAETTQLNLRGALDELAELTGVSMQSVTRSCVGAAGVSAPMVGDWIISAFRPLVGGALLLVEDVEIALDAAFQGQRGVLVLAGTGSNVAGRGIDGKVVTAGGWGPALSDEGSGYFLGIEALRRGFLAIDQQRSTILLDVIQQHWGLGSIGELVAAANANPSPDFSQLAPMVVDCANRGDAIAIEVIRLGGSELASLATLVIERIRRSESADSAFSAPPVAMAGSILEKVPLARQALAQSLRGIYSAIDVREDPTDPVKGALWRARQPLSGNPLPQP